MTKIIKSLVVTIVLLVNFGLVVGQAWAEDVKFTVTSYITKNETMPVPDAEGHILILGERRGVAVFADGNVAAYHTRYTCDLNNMLGPCEGYTDLTYMDKSQAMLKYQATVEMPQGKKFPMMKGKGDYIKGTGRFEGIKGSISFDGYFVTPYAGETKGDMVVHTSGSYTLPTK